MKYKIGNYNWFFQPVASNVLRCTLTKGKEKKNNSKLIQKKVLKQHFKKNEQRVFVEVSKDAIVFKSKCVECFRLSGFSLKEIDVIKYSTFKEEPRIEIIKTVDGQRTQIANLQPYKDREAFKGDLVFNIADDTGIFGLGQDEDGQYNRRGTKFYMYQHNMRTPIPVMMTDKGYGVVFDCPSLMIFDDTEDQTKITFDCVDQIDFYLIVGNMDEVISGYRYLTGEAVLLPKWAFGYIQSKERYVTQFEVVDTAKKHRDSGVPLDCIVQDWKTWEGQHWGQKTVDKNRYPDLLAMNRDLHEMNVHSMVSIWPNMADDCADHNELREAGYLLGDYSTYNAFDKKARHMYWEQIERELYHGGFDSWWCDSTEPFTAPDWCGKELLPEKKRYELVGGEHKKYLDPALANIYALLHAKGIYENQRKSDKDKRVFNLTRSGYIGIQKYGVALWAGDTSASWTELKKEIPKGLNLCMSGIPFWTIDIGAFFVGGTACWRKWCGNPQAEPVWFWDGNYDEGVSSHAYQELYTRWLQFGAFLPLFRSHGTDTPREIWNFGKPGEMFYDAIEKFINLRYRLMPYIYSMAMGVAFKDATMMRSLLFDFSDDKAVKGIDDQFMFGECLMVCPVTNAMYYNDEGKPIDVEKSRTCYLPLCAGWFDFWSGEFYKSGQTIIADAEIDSIPLFVKAGSILIMQKPVQHAMEETSALEIKVFKGADATCVYYEDDGTSYKYLNGQYEWIQFNWFDSKKQLVIEECSKFRTSPIAMEIYFEADKKIIDYNGGIMKINLG